MLQLFRKGRASYNSNPGIPTGMIKDTAIENEYRHACPLSPTLHRLRGRGKRFAAQALR